MLIFRRITTCVLALVSVLLICVGGSSVMLAIQAGDPAMYSVRDDYMGDAVRFGMIGLVGLLACQRLWRRGSRWAWMLVPFGFALYVLLFPTLEPGHYGDPFHRSHQGTAQQLLITVATAMEHAKDTDRFTCNPSPHQLGPSLFSQKGQTLPYVVQCHLNATGPITGIPLERPGMIHMAVSPDRTQAWFTATVLPDRISRRATWLKEGEQPLIITKLMK